MTPEGANAIIDLALGKLGPVESEDESYFRSGRFDHIHWLPSHVRRVRDSVRAIELYRGDRLPETTIQAMRGVVDADAQVQPCFFVPEDNPHEHLLDVCRENGIALIVKVADEYEPLVFAGHAAVAAVPVARIPDWILDDIPVLGRLRPAFREALNRFSRGYRELLRCGETADEAQENYLGRVFKSLLGSDGRFRASYDPLQLLRFFEQVARQSGRDHYFHTFNNFLLGCLIMDHCYTAFEQFRDTCLIGATAQNWSIEYVWLLTVLFHDVGYPIQKRGQTSELIYGVQVGGVEETIRERAQAWQSPAYLTARRQLISLYDYLSQLNIDSAWSGDPFPLVEHALDRAFQRSFLSEGHGVASCMRMLAEFFREVPSLASRRQFLARHIFLAGLSIPFHDWPTRRCLREEGIVKIKTSRFPFASLLMFVDSIQEDRRGRTQTPDILTGISITGNTVAAQMDLSILSPEQVREKKREVRDVKDFLDEDLIRFCYPEELTRE